MRPFVGFLALLLTFALASPSMVVTSAAGDSSESQSCSAVAADPVIQLDAAIRAEQLKALAERANSGHADAEIVVLNNRGYNYGPAPRPELGSIELERALEPRPEALPSPPSR